jgi:hypothetical protein
MKISRRSLVWCLLLLPVLWWLWPHEENAPRDALSRTSSSSPKQVEKIPGTNGEKAEREKTARRRDTKSSNLAPSTPASAEVDAILVDESMTHEQAAQRLRDIAADPSFPLPQREEALQHGLNLQPSAFGGFAEAQSDLPVELAGPLLREMINFNDSPADQLRTYLALKNHPDPEIAEQALEMLAFMVEDDAREKTPEQWEQMAREKLRKMEEGKEE